MTSSSFGNAPRMKLLCALIASCFAAEGFANPTGPTVAAGAASFNTVGKSLTITNSPNAIINWKGFSIGAGEATRFQQQSAASAVLNRVVGQDPSAIFGTLSSNGRVFLINPNGVLFGQGSRIDVAGLVASTLNITNQDFLAGRLNFQAGAVAGSVVNQGEIVSASGGRIYLIAPDVQNHGLISSPSGEVVLAAGKTVSLVDADVPNLKVEVQAGGEALNVGKIIAEGGKVGIYAGLINQRGVVRADSVSQDATGRIVFKASDTTILDDGSVTSAAGAKGGEIQVLGNKVGLVGTAKIDASGDAGGGTVLIGGDYQGKNPEVQNAWRTYVGLQSSITADAITSGDGGKVIVWADDATRAYGTISARGGSQSGNGGFVEVSGKNWLDFNASVDTRAYNGAAGVLLLDPAQVNIDSSEALGLGASFSGGDPNIFSGGVGPSTISWTTIKNHLTGAGGGSNTNVYITTSGTQVLCSLPGSCGIDIVAASGDLQSTNNLRLISHEHITVQAGTGITNTGSGALEMYAGWNGTSPATAPVLTNGNGVITINAPINFPAGNVLLRAYSDITSSAAGSITTPNLLASSLNGAVTLNSATNMVGTLAGEFHDDFQFTNAQSLTIGTVGAVSGISTVPSAGGAPTLTLNVTGNLIVNSPISVSDGGGSDGTTSITLNAPSISVNNTTVNATADVNDSGDGQPASVVLNATSGGILISNSAVSANGGQGGGGGDSGGSATVGLNAFGGISVNSSSTISAIGGAGAPDSISGANGGDANVALHAGGTIDTSASTLSATGGAPVNGGTAGVGTATLEVSSSSGNASPNGDIVVQNVTAGNVNLQQQSLSSARSILRASGTSLITANQVLMEIDDANNVGGGSIGTSVAPMRIQAARLEAHTHEVSPGIFIDSPNAGNLQIGGVSFFSGSVKGVQALAGGDISIAVNGTLTLQAGAANSPCGVGTGGPICTTSGNVTLRAEDMAIGHSVVGTGTMVLAPFTQSRQINIESSPSGGVLSLTPSEIALVSTPGTLEIGRVDGNATIVVNTALATGNVNAGTLRLYSGNINLTTGGADIGSSGTPFAHNLELKANNDVQLTVGNIYLADGKNLTVVADNDASGFGNVNIGAVSVLVGSTGANTGSMTLQGRNINAIISGGGGGNLRVFGTGNQTITASADAIFRNNNNSTGSLFVQADGGSQSISANSIELTAGSGPSTVAQILALAGNQNLTVGSGGLTLLGGGGTAASSDAMISAQGAQSIIVNGGGDITLTGGSGSGNNNSARIRALVGSQTITFNSGGDLVLTGGTVGNLNFAQIVANNATIGAQTQTITGATGITLTGGASGGGLDGSNNSLGNFARILNNNGSQNISVGAGGITVTGGGGPLTSNFAGIFQATSTGAPGTTQTLTVNNGGTITLQGGSSAQTNVINNTGNFFRGSYAMIQGNGDSQNINFTSGGAINLTGGSVGSNNPAQIHSRFGLQTISGAPSITLQGGTGGYVDVANNKNEGNFARIHGDAGGQTITASTITMTGGASGVGNHAQIFNSSTTAGQQITATSISLTGGAGGGIDSGSTGQSMSNYANIQSQAAQTIGAASLTLHAGAGGTENFAVVTAPTQDIVLSGDLILVGGASAAGAVRGGGARIGGPGGTTPAATNLTLDVGGDVTMTGGSVASAGTSIGSGFAGGQTTTITMNVGGDVTLNSGAGAGSTIGSPASNTAGGDISIVAGGNVTLNGGTAIRTLGAIEIDAGGALTLTGGSSGVGQSALVSSGGDQTIIANSITLAGGVAGGADLNGNFARLVSTGGVQTIVTSADMTLTAGAAGINNYAVIQAPTQVIAVLGNLSLTGGGSSASVDGTTGGGARIGGLGGAGATPTNLTLLVDGNVTMTGGTVANAGATIGSNIQGGQPTTITMDVGGNVTLNPGTVANAGSRIGSPAANVAGGDISIFAGGTVALNSNPGLGTFIRTLGNVTINATSITQGADSAIIAGGATSLVGGTISLGSASNDFTGPVDIFGTNVTIKDANTLTLGGVEASDLTVAASTVNQNSSGIGVTGATNISAGAVALTSATNDFGTVNVISSGNVAITDANAISVGNASVGGTFDIVATSTSFLNGFSANNYTFSGGSYTLATGTYNLGGTTTVASSSIVTASGATLNAAGGTMNVSGTFNAFGGTITVGSLNVLAGGTLSGTGTIVGNVNNSAGIVSPGASPGILTINGNYIQGPAGVLDAQIGGLVAGTDYDQLKVIGSASLAGTVNTTLINGFVPTTGTAFTLVDASGGISGTFTTVNQPSGALFNTFYGPTTFQVVGAALTTTTVPEQIVGTVNQVFVTTEQLAQPQIELLEPIMVSVIPPATTTTPEGQIVPKPPACN